MAEINEIWKPVVGWEDCYMVSSMGRVKSLDRWVNSKSGSLRFSKGKILSHNIDKDGYHSVTLCVDNKVKKMRVHRLVAETFLPNPKNYPIINHRDENPSNNILDNLEWCDISYNTAYSCGKPVLQLTKEGKIIKLWNTAIDAQNDLNIDHSQISACCKNKPKYYTAGGFKWMYLDDYFAIILEQIQDEDMKKEKRAV